MSTTLTDRLPCGLWAWYRWNDNVPSSTHSTPPDLHYHWMIHLHSRNIQRPFPNTPVLLPLNKRNLWLFPFESPRFPPSPTDHDRRLSGGRNPPGLKDIRPLHPSHHSTPPRSPVSLRVHFEGSPGTERNKT